MAALTLGRATTLAAGALQAGAQRAPPARSSPRSRQQRHEQPFQRQNHPAPNDGEKARETRVAPWLRRRPRARACASCGPGTPPRHPLRRPRGSRDPMTPPPMTQSESPLLPRPLRTTCPPAAKMRHAWLASPHRWQDGVSGNLYGDRLSLHGRESPRCVAPLQPRPTCCCRSLASPPVLVTPALAHFLTGVLCSQIIRAIATDTIDTVGIGIAFKDHIAGGIFDVADGSASSEAPTVESTRESPRAWRAGS